MYFFHILFASAKALAASQFFVVALHADTMSSGTDFALSPPFITTIQHFKNSCTNFIHPNFGVSMDGIFFFGIFSAMGLIFTGKEKAAMTLLWVLLPCIATWFIYNIKFALNISL